MYPRDLVVKILTQVLSFEKPLDEVLESFSEELTTPQVRAWVQELSAGVLRWKGRLDFLIDSLATKKKPSGWLRKILLVGAYQLVVQDRVTANKVVFETVEEVKRKEGEAPARFANACLRRIAEQAPQWRNLSWSESMSSEESAFWASLPHWLWNKLVTEYGIEWTTSFAEACLQRPSLWLRSLDQLTFGQQGPLPDSWKIEEGGLITEKEGFKAGTFFVQDISSQKLIDEVTQILKSKSESLGSVKVWDVCAAPGGKSVGLAWNGLQVVSSDKSGSKRLSLLKETVQRVAPQVCVIESDEEVDALPLQDLVWVDAPCSGTGIIRRHPDVKWIRKEKDIPQLNQLQLELLKKAWSKVKPQGFLVYSVCSVLKEEGPALIQKAGIVQNKTDLKSSEGKIIQEWSLSPQFAPYGDGFWAVMLQKI